MTKVPSKPKKTYKPDDPKQSKRFIEMAEEIGVDKRKGSFDKAFDKVSPLKKRAP